VPLVDNSDNKNLVVIDFLKGLYSNFSKFTNNNPYIHFSISLTLFKKDTPISIVYELGEKYLKQAKSLAKKDMLNVENDDDAKKGLKKYIIAGIDD
jgi:CRISPR/Cas system-associated protein Cas10 (large subunit of type III CRISPR-Cas system)